MCIWDDSVTHSHPQWEFVRALWRNRADLYAELSLSLALPTEAPLDNVISSLRQCPLRTLRARSSVAVGLYMVLQVR